MNIYFEAFGLFSKIGLFTIGGGYAMVPLIEEEIVDKPVSYTHLTLPTIA